MAHVIFSYSNICKYLQVDYSEILSRLICMGTCIVRLNNGEKIKIVASDIKPIMESDRINRSHGIQIYDKGHYYKAYNPKTKKTYFLEPEKDHISCTCDDYYNQLNFFSKQEAICKHGYALLEHLGCNSLSNSEYQEMIREIYEIAEYESICDRNEMTSYAWQDDSRYWS